MMVSNMSKKICLLFFFISPFLLKKEQNALNDLMLGTITSAHLPPILFALCFTPVENVPTLIILFTQSLHPPLSLIMHTSVRFPKNGLDSEPASRGSQSPPTERGAGCGISHLLCLQSDKVGPSSCNN